MEIYFETSRMIVSAIDTHDYEPLLKIYNEPKKYQYATGIMQGVSKDELINKIVSDNRLDGSFFLSGRLNDTGTPVNYIKGQLHKSGLHCNIWISMLLTLEGYCRKGYASEFFESLYCYFVKNYLIKTTFISIHPDNTEGLGFWTSLGFSESYYKMPQNTLIYARKSKCNALDHDTTCF